VRATAAPQDERRAEVDRLYTEAEQATEAYNKADARTEALREEVSTAQDAIARQQGRINTMRDALGSLAGAQYRSGGIDPSLALLLSADPDDYLDKASVLDRVTTHQAGRLKELQEAMRDLAQDRAETAAKLAELEKGRKAVAAHKKTVEKKLAEARELLNSLPDEERAAHDRGSRSGRTDLTIPGGAAPASGRAAAAVAAARSALGKPYVWGANGPGSYDCSGLTQAAWKAAGVTLPRTTYDQVDAGTTVPVSQAQPGDLVFFYDDLSHVGLYIGNGMMIHAPKPGAYVREESIYYGGESIIHSFVRPA
ncbi:NlpC/P60 family protein, partial [Streptomyces sp. NPDC058964]|uniref:C40 family peptidase n=1 Tax=Streptomyces sp. NPDC058964 TaxID=3346681 RepID=UPI0036901E94